MNNNLLKKKSSHAQYTREATTSIGRREIRNDLKGKGKSIVLP
jgi:hypothetical protein